MARPSQHNIHPRTRVLSALKRSKTALSAYDILEKLKKHGIHGAPIVYRALKQLEADAAIHRIDSLNAYVACRCSHAHSHPYSVLAICAQCHAVEEIHDARVMDHIEGLRTLGVSLLPHSTLECKVLCAGCSQP